MPAQKAKRPVEDCQPLQKLPANRGGYYYLTVPAATANSFSRGPKTRLQCVLDNTVMLACGLNPLGDGNYFIIVAARHVKALKKREGDMVDYTVSEDVNPLGVVMPEVLEALLEQDEDLKKLYEGLTDGKKRSLIFLMGSTKDIDRQVQKAIQFLGDIQHNRSPYRRSKKA